MGGRVDEEACASGLTRMANAAKQRAYLDFVLEELAPMGEMTSRAMFSGYALYCDGTVFALIAGSALYLKTDAGNRPEFEAKGLKPFRPFKDRDSVMQYYQAPAEIFEDAEARRKWVGSAIAAGERTQSKKKLRGRGKKITT